MILFFRSLLDTIKTLSWIDFVFFVAVLFLIILIVSLIYFIMINNEDVIDKKEEVKEDIVKDKNKENENVSTIAIFEDQDDPNEDGDLIDLRTITKKLSENKGNTIDLTAYEADQEERAIISYEELLAKKNNYTLDYKEEDSGPISIKKVNIEEAKNKQEEPKIGARAISYEKEEAFLEALKKLQEQIN